MLQKHGYGEGRNRSQPDFLKAEAKMTTPLLRAILRTDLPSFTRKDFGTVSPGERFQPNWHIDAITYQLEQVMAGRTRRLIINQPLRSLKSMTGRGACRRS